MMVNITEESSYNSLRKSIDDIDRRIDDLRNFKYGLEEEREEKEHKMINIFYELDIIDNKQDKMKAINNAFGSLQRTKRDIRLIDKKLSKVKNLRVHYVKRFKSVEEWLNDLKIFIKIGDVDKVREIMRHRGMPKTVKKEGICKEIRCLFQESEHNEIRNFFEDFERDYYRKYNDYTPKKYNDYFQKTDIIDRTSGYGEQFQIEFKINYGDDVKSIFILFHPDEVDDELSDFLSESYSRDEMIKLINQPKTNTSLDIIISEIKNHPQFRDIVREAERVKYYEEKSNHEQ